LPEVLGILTVRLGVERLAMSFGVERDERHQAACEYGPPGKLRG